MEKNLYTAWAKQYLSNVESIEKDSHGDQSEVFHIRTAAQNYVLKIASDLKGERDRIEWLQSKLPVPVLIKFAHIEGKDVLLMTELAGKNLASLAKDWSAQNLVRSAAEVMRTFHRTDTSDCPFGESGEGKVLLHGDACLPNFMFDGNDFSGYIDLGNVSVGDAEDDLAATVWSIERNLGPGYGAQFLREYGHFDYSEEKAEALKLRYEATRHP